MWTFKDFIYIIIYSIIRAFYCVMTSFPINKNLIFVNNFDGKGIGDSEKYIVSELRKLEPNITVVWVAENNDNVDKNTIFVKENSLQRILLQATAKIWISNVRMPLYSIKRKEQVYMQTWHGHLAFKMIEDENPSALTKRYIVKAKHDSTMIDYYVAGSVDQVNVFKKYFWYKNGEILRLGCPRNDIFANESTFNTHEIKKNIKNELGINENERIVIYAPTFRKGYGFETYNLDFGGLLNTLYQKTGDSWTVIIRMHPVLAEKSNEFLKYNDHLINGSRMPDVQELLLISDALITDYSSIAFDFAYTDRPILLFAPDVQDFKKDRDFHIQIEDTPFPLATTNEELFYLIKNYDRDAYLDKLKLFRNAYGFYPVGNSSYSAASVLMEHLV